AHAGGARREDGQIGAALALQLELVLLDALADLVVRYLQRSARWRHRLVLGVGCRGLFLAEAVQVLRFGGVVAVAVDDHWGAVLLTAMLRGGARLSNRGGIRIATPCVWDVLWDALRRHPEGAGQAFRGNDDMADLPRLNGVIRALEQGQHALTCF